MTAERLHTLPGATIVRELERSWLVELADGTRVTLPFAIGHVSRTGAVQAPSWWFRDRGLEIPETSR